MRKLLIVMTVFGAVLTNLTVNAGFEIVEITDEFEGRTIIRMKSPEKVDIPDCHDYITVYAGKFTDPKGGVIHILEVHYLGPHWMFIRESESLLLKVDGELFKFDTFDILRDVIWGGDVVEKAFYDVTTEFLVRLANAEEVAIKVRGKKFFLEGTFRDELFDQFKEFCLYCVITSVRDHRPIEQIHDSF